MRQSNTTIPALPVYDQETLEIYGNACYDAGRADHVDEVERLADMTDEEIADCWPTVFEMPRNPRLPRFARAIAAFIAKRRACT